ncbi:MAG: hypothetical protein ACRDGJ_00420, partial [Candidatus Limnocylindria bacterium]
PLGYELRALCGTERHRAADKALTCGVIDGPAASVAPSGSGPAGKSGKNREKGDPTTRLSEA